MISISLFGNTNAGYALKIKDNGVGIPEYFSTETSDSLGMILINGLATQLDGSTKLTSNNGTELLVKFKEAKYKTRM
jgi:two-component sensor histidine kinase